MNYKIITDEKILRDFIDWLPELQPSETYYVCLFARSKYCKGITHISTDKAQLKRFTTNKERMFDKIKQCETELGNYKQKDKPIPQEALAIYITPNPRCFLKATRQSLKKFADLLSIDYNGYNPHQKVMSEIQKAKSRTCFVDFDFDIKEKNYKNFKLYIEEILNKIFLSINVSACTVLNTRGGFHLLIDPNKVHSAYKKSWYNEISKLENVDIKGDNMIPIPGTYQGGFTPYFLSY